MTEEVVVSLKYGKVRGSKEKSVTFGAEFYSFYGIPYAQPPIGKLRFRDPVKVQPWKCIRDGTIKREGCLQYSTFQHRILGSEDCLYVNIYTPSLPREGIPPKAVVVFIHPGGQQWGSPDPIHHGSPDFIMHHDVVYVAIGFRLNIFGFLNLKLPECSGNQGLKDIIMAFKWIHENIREFNGDPNNITAIGPSSGAVIIHILLLTPAVKGLFHKAILMGHYLFNVLVPYREDQISLALNFARPLGFQGDDPRKLLSFLKTVPGHLILVQMRAFQNTFDSNLQKSFYAGPFMESIDDFVIPESPRKYIDSMERVPLIYGMCDKESIIGFIRTMKQPDENILRQSYRQNVWGWMNYLNDDELEEIHRQTEAFYFADDVNKNQKLSTKVDISSDAAYSEVYDTLINLTAGHFSSSVYVYKFQYESEIAFLKNKLQKFLAEEVQGTFHTDDMCFWSCINTPHAEKTIKVIDQFTKLFTNFAKTGDPNYKGIETQWIPNTLEKPCYLSINNELKMINGKLYGERMEFWDNLKKLYKKD